MFLLSRVASTPACFLAFFAFGVFWSVPVPVSESPVEMDVPPGDSHKFVEPFNGDSGNCISCSVLREKDTEDVSLLCKPDSIIPTSCAGCGNSPINWNMEFHGSNAVEVERG